MAGGFLGSVSGQVRLDIRQAVAAYAAVRAQNQRLVYALRGTGDAFIATGQGMTTAGLGLVYVFGKAVTAAAEFERKMDFFGAVSDTSAEKMQELSKFTLQLAQDTIYSAGQIADGFIELGKAGVSAEGIINGIGEAMANLGAAGDIPLAQSGQIITSTLQQFDLEASRAVEVVDLLAGAANASIADITDIGVSLKYVGGVANSVGLSFEDTATAISLLAKAGIRGSTAGTSLRQMLVSLGGATGPATDQLKALGIITENGGNKFFTAEGKAKSLAEIFQILQTHTADLTQKQRLMALRTIFNNRALSAASILTREGAAGFREMNAEMSKTTAADVAAKRLDNLSGDIEILKGNIETLLITAGGPFQDMLRDWVQEITNLVQAFSDLDPQTQKMIVQTIALTGVLLTAMGIFNIIIGTVFKFAAHMLKLGAAIGFVFKWGRAVLYLFGLIFGGAVVSTVGLIVAGVIAIGAAFVIAYKKIKPFRDFINDLASGFKKNVVDPIVAGAKNIARGFQVAFTDPKRAWELFKQSLIDGVEQVGSFFERLGGSIKGAFDDALGAAGRFVDGVIAWFASLPSRILGALASLGEMLTRIFTFENLGYVVGLAIGTVVNAFVTLPATLLSLAARAVTAVVNAFVALPGEIGYLIGFMIGTAVRMMIGLAARLGPLAARAVAAVVRFFVTLPGRISGLVARTVVAFVNSLVRMVGAAVTHGPRIVNGLLRFLQTLPQRTVALMARVVLSFVNAIPRAARAARDIGWGVFRGIVNTINNLPSVVGGVLDRVIAAFLGVITAGYRAAKNFASGLWEGFKDGLGINSPSFIERQMWQITGVIDEETKKMAKQTMKVQSIGRKLASTQLTMPGMTAGTLADTRAIQSRAGITLGSSAGGGVTGNSVNIKIENPKPERASESITKVGRRKVVENGWA